MDTHSLRNSSNTGFFSLSTKTLINENGQLELKEIHKLVQEGDIFDIRKAEQEIVLLISDLIPSNSLSLIEKRKLEEVGYQVKLSILLDAFSRLLSDKAAIYNFPDSSMDHLSDEIREQYQGKKLSKSSLLKLETEAISMNGKLLDQLNDSASVSSLISFLNRSQALETKLLYELYQISELRNQVASLRLMRSI
ncbi:hypothetical protein TUMSATVNIG1_60890 (plasmid) [Vibrio nigripulchritudo]|nr:hypothetical protein VNTUMSATTG_60420 [Vibrio nigripulchritudo]BDU35480.1 hypothetical protein TUMSATVNIG1_60890 [Vibrio nigripulchritudo]